MRHSLLEIRNGDLRAIRARLYVLLQFPLKYLPIWCGLLRRCRPSSVAFRPFRVDSSYSITAFERSGLSLTLSTSQGSESIRDVTRVAIGTSLDSYQSCTTPRLWIMCERIGSRSASQESQPNEVLSDRSLFWLSPGLSTCCTRPKQSRSA